MTQLSQEEIQERLKNLSPEQVQELIKQQCVFCKIVAGEIPTYKVYEDEAFLAFLDANPANAGHTLVIPKQHISVLPQMPDKLAASIGVLITKLSAIIFEATGAEGINILQNNGQVAGQVVPHVHFHIIPRHTEDKAAFSWEPKKLSKEQFEEAQKKILERLSQPMRPASSSETASIPYAARPPEPAKKEVPAKKEKPEKARPRLP